MLLQRAGMGTLPPSGFTHPAWESLAASWDAAPKPTQSTVVLGPAEVSLGHDDVEADDALPTDGKDHAFGWDNENPQRSVHVAAFRVEWRPITNGDFYTFYNGAGKGKVKMPTSWLKVGEETQVSLHFFYDRATTD